MRDPGFATGEVYHIYSRSIANFKIFNTANDFERIRLLLRLQQGTKRQQPLSWLIKIGPQRVNQAIEESCVAGSRVQVIAFCIMQTHFHLLLRQTEKDGISDYMNDGLNSYTRYFNTKCKRKGPLWESRFQDRHVKTSDDALHMTRYIHLNPVTAGLVERPGDWKYSSYGEYLNMISRNECLCEFRDIVNLMPESYKKFVANRIDYQRKLARLKKIEVDDPAIP